MKKYIVVALVAGVSLFQFCSGPKSAQVVVPKVTYTADVEPLITATCSPCHIPPKGNKEPLHTYATAKANFEESVRRIQLNPGEKGFMPMRHPKLSDSAIHVFTQWKADGFIEK